MQLLLNLNLIPGAVQAGRANHPLRDRLRTAANVRLTPRLPEPLPPPRSPETVLIRCGPQAAAQQLRHLAWANQTGNRRPPRARSSPF